jgi:hypothetical protein
MLNARELPSFSGPKYDPIGVGAYPARLLQVITLGIQPQRPFKGEEKPPALELMTVYELLDEFLPGEDGEPDENKPRVINERFAFYSLENTKANSTKRYYSLDPNEAFQGDWNELVGIPCLVNVIQYTSKRDGSIKNGISGVSGMRAKEAAKAPELVNEPVAFDFYEPVYENLEKLYPWVIDTFSKAIDYKGSKLEEMVEKFKAVKSAPESSIPKVEKKVVKKKVVVEDNEEEAEDEDQWG